MNEYIFQANHPKNPGVIPIRHFVNHENAIALVAVYLHIGYDVSIEQVREKKQ